MIIKKQNLQIHNDKLELTIWITTIEDLLSLQMENNLKPMIDISGEISIKHRIYKDPLA